MNPPKKPCTLIAEIGCNHMGDIAIAKQLIDVAHSFCQITHVKFQKRNSRELLTDEQYNAPHPNPANSFGRTYGEHREFLEFDLTQHRELKEYCDKKGMVYATSVWDMSSLMEIVSLQPAYIKIPSAVNTNLEMLDRACSVFKNHIHLSLGMTTRKEEKAIIDLFVSRGRAKDLVLYACTSGYPIEASETHILEILRLKEAYGRTVGAIAYSGHHKGIAIDVGAATLGAEYIERHFTLDRTWKGTDHAASLEPDGLRRLNKSLQRLHEALTYKPAEIVEIELAQREKLKWRPKVQTA